MRRSQGRALGAVAIAVLFVTLVFLFLQAGPDPQAGKCVDMRNELVGCEQNAALFRLVREVDSERDCPSDSLKLYRFRSSLFCGVALRGAPAPSSEYVSCLLLAGAELARRPADLSFAAGFGPGARSASAERTGTVKVRGDGWRIFYVLHEGQLDPGLPAIVADPGRVASVAYVAHASAQREEVAAATRCATGRQEQS